VASAGVLPLRFIGEVLAFAAVVTGLFYHIAVIENFPRYCPPPQAGEFTVISQFACGTLPFRSGKCLPTIKLPDKEFRSRVSNITIGVDYIFTPALAGGQRVVSTGSLATSLGIARSNNLELGFHRYS
jgi:hypothetical protein